MLDLNELYQDLIIDHSQHPRHFGRLESADYCEEGYNPLCGDRVMVYMNIENIKEPTIKLATFEGQGCAISMASASLMMEIIMGRTICEVKTLFQEFQYWMVTPTQAPPAHFGKLIAFSGVKKFPMRVKCATLCWHTILAALSPKKLLEPS